MSLDRSTKAISTIDYAHHEIHSGSHYFLTRVVTKNDTEEEEIRIKTPDTAKWSHMTLSIEGTGELDFKLFEDTSKEDVPANELTPINRNRNSDNVSGNTICHTPSGSGDGTLIAETLFGVDVGGGSNRQLSGGGLDSRSEVILKQNSAYLLNILSGTASNRITVILDWYEHTNKESSTFVG